jgi:hypothetical protein
VINVANVNRSVNVHRSLRVTLPIREHRHHPFVAREDAPPTYEQLFGQ